jgi:hypothetical protein
MWRRGLNSIEREQLRQLFQKVDSNVSYEQLKPIASAVAFWGIKAGVASPWKELLATGGKPSFKYDLAKTDVAIEEIPLNSRPIPSAGRDYYRLLRSAIKKIIGKAHA